MENNICWCGHTKEKHTIQYDACCDDHSDDSYPICIDCAESTNFDYECDHYFQQDNLKYLEKLSEDSES